MMEPVHHQSLNDSELLIRRAKISDLPHIQELYVNTIYQVCEKDYTENQLDAWAASIDNQDRWHRAINEQYFIVAEWSSQLVGFASLQSSTHIDFLFVHTRYQGLGIATKLLTHIENHAKHLQSTFLTAHVSITARPFFEKNGFAVLYQRMNEIYGQQLVNFQMKRYLS